jgi:hypothetical protein
MQNTPPAISTAINVIEIPLTSPSLYISQYCGRSAPARRTAERIPKRRTGAFVPALRPAYRGKKRLVLGRRSGSGTYSKGKCHSGFERTKEYAEPYEEHRAVFEGFLVCVV